jgi:tetratricopeptide (TPR) repeat protein
MTRVRSLVVACSLALGLVAGGIVVEPAVVQAAEASKKISAKVSKPLKAAQDAMAKKDWDAALAAIKDAQAIPKKSPYEEYQIDEFLGFVLIQQQNYGEAAVVFERMINSGQTPPEQLNDRIKTTAQLYSQVKDYPKTVEWTRKWLEANPGDPSMTLLLAQASYLQNDFNTAAQVSSKLIADAESQGQTPEENWIEILLSSYFKLDNQQGLVEALKKSVRYYPKPERWENLLDIYARRENGDRVNLGYYRLMLDNGLLKRAGDYMEMAQLAKDAGVPGEAHEILEKGYSAGVMKSDDKQEQARYDRTRAELKKAAEADRASLPQLAQEAAKAAKGQVDVGLGQAYLSFHQYDEAIAAIERGLQKGSVNDVDEAHISLGMAHLKNGNPEQAREAFKKVKPDSKWAGVAELWTLRTYT